MGFLERIFSGQLDKYIEKRGLSQNNFESGKWDDLYSSPSKSGVRINQDNVTSLSGVYAATRVYTDAISSLPIHVMKEGKDRKEKLFNHPVRTLLKNPNQLMTSSVWRQIAIPHILLWGNSYNLIEFEKGGSFRPKAILPVHPKNVQKVEIQRGVLVYHIALDDGEKFVVDQSQMLHFRCQGDNLMGKSVIDVARDNLGAAKATDDFGGAFYRNSASLNGVLTTDVSLNDKAYENIKKSWDKAHKGVNNANSTAILEQGLKYQSITMSPENAQFLETKRFAIEDIARWFKLPPHTIADLSHATFTNIDAQDLNLVKHSILPLVVMMEQEIDRKLFREQEKQTTYVKFNLEGLLRGDIKTRFEAYKIGIQNGFMTLNEARAKEDMNPMEGLDNTWMQLNTAPIVDGTNQQKVEQTTKQDENNEDKEPIQNT